VALEFRAKVSKVATEQHQALALIQVPRVAVAGFTPVVQERSPSKNQAAWAAWDLQLRSPAHQWFMAQVAAVLGTLPVALALVGALTSLHPVATQTPTKAVAVAVQTTGQQLGGVLVAVVWLFSAIRTFMR
jgi:hypothetical protein